MKENDFWKVCEALDSELRIKLIRYLLEIESTEFLSVSELAERMNTSEPAMSVHLKKLSVAGLVASKRADRRVYYRAFATTPEGELVVRALRKFFALRPRMKRLQQFLAYAHALSHHRRNAIVRSLKMMPGMEVKELADQTEMPPHTADRLWGDLNKSHIVDLDGRIVEPETDPELTLLKLTLA